MMEERIERCLRDEDVRNAVFLAERHLASCGEGAERERALNLLARSLYRSGQVAQARGVLLRSMGSPVGEDPWRADSGVLGAASPENRFFFAQCCFTLGRFREAQSALLYATDFLTHLHRLATSGRAPVIVSGEAALLTGNAISRECCTVIPNGASGLYLLGRICLAENRRDHAFVCFSLALHFDPYLFDAYEQICALGKGNGEDGASSFFFGGGNDHSDHNGKKRGNAREKEDSSSDMLQTFKTLGSGLSLVCDFKCDEALQVLRSKRLPSEQRETGWVYHQIGRALFEAARYREAAEAFEHMRRLSPERLEGLELYSTNLWHLKKETELAFLAQQAVEFGKTSPQAWCVVGNCFSLQKEHDIAIKFFQRAIQVDPTFTYAYTLTGHEYASNEDLEKALSCYRHAIRIDERHYNAWYGVGTIFQRQEKYELAESHFSRALQINPQSSILYCILASVMQNQNRFSDALIQLAKASELQPKNPQSMFQRAKVLFDCQRYIEAHQELLQVRDLAPKEPGVHALLGHVCCSLGRKSEALVHLTTALDLDPKDSSRAKTALDGLSQSDL